MFILLFEIAFMKTSIASGQYLSHGEMSNLMSLMEDCSDQLIDDITDLLADALTNDIALTNFFKTLMPDEDDEEVHDLLS